VKTFYPEHQIQVSPRVTKPGIANARNACAEAAGKEKFMMFDDDLELLIRRDDHEYKLRGMTPDDVHRMVREVEDTLNCYAHVGLSMREGNNRILADFVLNCRMIRATAYHGAVLQMGNIQFDPLFDTKEDLEMTLRLLSMGYQNLVFYKYAQGQGASDAPGGCNAEYVRDEKQMLEKARLLAAKYPHCVEVTAKATSGAWGGGVRPEVRIFWKRAFENRGRLPISDDEEQSTEEGDQA